MHIFKRIYIYTENTNYTFARKCDTIKMSASRFVINKCIITMHSWVVTINLLIQIVIIVLKTRCYAALRIGPSWQRNCHLYLLRYSYKLLERRSPYYSLSIIITCKFGLPKPNNGVQLFWLSEAHFYFKLSRRCNLLALGNWRF